MSDRREVVDRRGDPHRRRRAIVLLLVVRQTQTRHVRENSAVCIVLILGVFGIIELTRALHGHSLGATTTAWIVGSLIAAAVFGVARPVTVSIWRDADGVALSKGTTATTILWIVSFLVHFGTEAGINQSTTVAGHGASSALLYLAVDPQLSARGRPMARSPDRVGGTLEVAGGTLRALREHKGT